MQWIVRLLQIFTALPVIWLGLGLISTEVDPPNWVPLWLAIGAVSLVVLPIIQRMTGEGSSK